MLGAVSGCPASAPQGIGIIASWEWARNVSIKSLEPAVWVLLR
jgi:hypothetical protein